MTGEHPPPAAVAETHISVLVSIGDRVYKLKKPVAMGFLDFSTLEARRAACHREVELNRRLAPDVYLGVADIVGPAGDVCDHLVVMRRMPAERRLATLVRAGHGVDDELRRIAHVIATFHASARTSAAIAEAASPQAVRGNWDASFEELQPFVGPVLDRAKCARVEELVHRYIDGRLPLFRQRMVANCVRDGHGDLQAEDIFCLDDGPRILDCIEFNDRLRHGDVLADVAFLAMDLERLGSPEGAGRFLELYRELSAETHPQTLAHHYVAYRAHVRAKVACLRHGQGDATAATAATSLLDLTLRHLEQGRVTVVVVGGLPGTGKSTLAAGIGAARGWSVLRSDEVRKDLAGLGHGERAGSAFGEGIYGPELTEATYRTMLNRARRAVTLGEPVVLDASWTDARRRRQAADLARETTSEFVELRCAVPADLAATRMAQRARKGGDPSDATPEVAAAMASVVDAWPSAVQIDTSGSPEQSLERALAVLGSPTGG
jgi:aminoglycoside phosphotransferase family enzyme/predicted kinase